MTVIRLSNNKMWQGAKNYKERARGDHYFGPFSSLTNVQSYITGLFPILLYFPRLLSLSPLPFFLLPL